MKTAVLVGAAGTDLRRFLHGAPQRAGYQPNLVQLGMNPSD